MTGMQPSSTALMMRMPQPSPLGARQKTLRRISAAWSPTIPSTIANPGRPWNATYDRCRTPWL